MRAELHCLLVALPTQRRAFIERQHATPLGDSIRMWMQSRGHADAASLWLEYEPIAQAILACAERLPLHARAPLRRRHQRHAATL